MHIINKGAYSFRALVQKIRNLYFYNIFLKIHEYNEDKKKWEFKPLILFRIKLNKNKKTYIGYDFDHYLWCPYNPLKITGESTERFSRDRNDWIKTYYKEKYLWQLKFKVVRTSEYNEDEFLDDVWREEMNFMAGVDIL